MGNKEINIKKRVLELLNKVDESISNLTVAELKAKFTKEIVTDDKNNEESYLALIKEFKDVYLKNHCNGRFGDELIVLHVRALKFCSYNTEYEKLYSLSGERISFNNLNVYKSEMGYNDKYSENRLREFEVISRDEYLILVGKYEKINTLITDIIKPKL